jgi:hypothetical protein
MTKSFSVALALAEIALQVAFPGYLSLGQSLRIVDGTRQQESSTPYTLKVDSTEVMLNCTVLNDRSQLVDGLSAASFSVWDDGRLQSSSCCMKLTSLLRPNQDLG